MKRRVVSCDFAPITCERAPTTAYCGPFLFNARITADPRQHFRPVALGDQQQRFHRDLPIGSIMLRFRQRGSENRLNQTIQSWPFAA